MSQTSIRATPVIPPQIAGRGVQSPVGEISPVFCSLLITTLAQPKLKDGDLIRFVALADLYLTIENLF